MARHQVLPHRLSSCTSAIPHPFCQRHPKIQSRASLGIVWPSAAASPRPPLPRRLITCRAGSAPVPRRLAHRRSVLMHDSPRSQQLDPTPKHPYPSTGASTRSPSIRATLPQRNNSTSSMDKAITSPPLATGRLHSQIRSSVTLHRHDAFLS